MPAPRLLCFVMMPFRPELHYFYLYLKSHIEAHHHVVVERADATILTKPILDKINDFIRGADVLIADCSGRNPNVFYELGIAHAHGKKVILITSDAITEAPSDIRHLEFIKYELDNDAEFLAKIDNALRNVFVERYEALYERAKSVFSDFKQSMGISVELAPKDVFQDRVIAAERTQDVPEMDDVNRVAEFVLPRVIADATDVRVMSQIVNWLKTKRSAT